MKSSEEEYLFNANSVDENINSREINIVVSWVGYKVLLKLNWNMDSLEALFYHYTLVL